MTKSHGIDERGLGRFYINAGNGRDERDYRNPKGACGRGPF